MSVKSKNMLFSFPICIKPTNLLHGSVVYGLILFQGEFVSILVSSTNMFIIHKVGCPSKKLSLEVNTTICLSYIFVS